MDEKEARHEAVVTEEELTNALIEHCPQCAELVQKLIGYKLQRDKQCKQCKESEYWRNQFFEVASIFKLSGTPSVGDVLDKANELMYVKVRDTPR